MPTDKQSKTQEAINRWEKIHGKKMTTRERVMFQWGYSYAINDIFL